MLCTGITGLLIKSNIVVAVRPRFEFIEFALDGPHAVAATGIDLELHARAPLFLICVYAARLFVVE